MVLKELKRDLEDLKRDLEINLISLVCKVSETKAGEILKLRERLGSRAVKNYSSVYDYGTNDFAKSVVDPLIRNIHSIAMDFFASKVKPVRRGMYNLFFMDSERRHNLREKYGYNPYTAVLNPTNECNKNCSVKCYMGSPYVGKRDEFPLFRMTEKDLEMLIQQNKEGFGMHFFVLSGGEPFLPETWNAIKNVFTRNRDICAVAFTNASCIDEKVADELAELGTIFPGISIDGWKKYNDMARGKGSFDEAMNAVKLLRERGLFFGISTTPTNKNFSELTNDDFNKFWIEQGVRYVYNFECMPVGIKSDMENILTPKQRLAVAEYAINRGLAGDKIFRLSFWGYGSFDAGCMAYGYNYYNISPPHIHPQKIKEHLKQFGLQDKKVMSAVMPCVFNQIICGYILGDGRVVGKNKNSIYESVVDFVREDPSMKIPRDNWIEMRHKIANTEHWLGFVPCRFFDWPDDLIRHQDLFIGFQPTFQVYKEPLLSQVRENAEAYKTYVKLEYPNMVRRLNKKYGLG